MRRTLLTLVIAVFSVIAISIARSISSGSNIDKRQKYWEEQLSGALNTGASKEELEAFAKTHGQILKCYQNYNKEDQCAFDDNQSLGGTSNMPMRLAVIFTLKDDKVAAHQFTTSPANQPK